MFVKYIKYKNYYYINIFLQMTTNNENDKNNTTLNNDNISLQDKINKLKILKDKIETLNIFHQIEILRILHNNNISVNENKNGVFINLSYVSDNVIDTINNYLLYVSKQENQLNEVEEEKKKITSTFFTN